MRSSAGPAGGYRLPLALLFLAWLFVYQCSNGSSGVSGEICDNRLDDDGDGAVDCVDSECRDLPSCQAKAESCSDGLDNDLDGDVDCVDSDCVGNVVCSEDCGNSIDDNGDDLADCADPQCKGIDPRCGEVCGDGIDNDSDGKVDCRDEGCFDVIPPCGGGGTTCAYGGSEPHDCQCVDGVDNDGDGYTDTDDLECFGPFDDDEGTFATGIPGDNKGAHGGVECPFDGNSGTGNDGVCCNLDNPSQNVTPNGCDNLGCCEVDVNGNLTGEHVYIRDVCDFTPTCGSQGTLGCACSDGAGCGPGQFCVNDDDSGAGFCSTCEPCAPNLACENTCECGEICYGGFTQPEAECGGGGTCSEGVTPCPNGDSDCDPALNERCDNGCCYAACPAGLIPCQVSTDCPTDLYYYCITGCCVEAPT